MKKEKRKNWKFPDKVKVFSPQIRGEFRVDSHWNQRDFGVTLAGKHGEISSFSLANAATTTVLEPQKLIEDDEC